MACMRSISCMFLSTTLSDSWNERKENGCEPKCCVWLEITAEFHEGNTCAVSSKWCVLLLNFRQSTLQLRVPWRNFPIQQRRTLPSRNRPTWMKICWRCCRSRIRKHLHRKQCSRCRCVQHTVVWNEWPLGFELNLRRSVLYSAAQTYGFYFHTKWAEEKTIRSGAMHPKCQKKQSECFLKAKVDLCLWQSMKIHVFTVGLDLPIDWTRTWPQVALQYPEVGILDHHIYISISTTKNLQGEKESDSSERGTPCTAKHSATASMHSADVKQLLIQRNGPWICKFLHAEHAGPSKRGSWKLLIRHRNLVAAFSCKLHKVEETARKKEKWENSTHWHLQSAAGEMFLAIADESDRCILSDYVLVPCIPQGWFLPPKWTGVSVCPCEVKGRWSMTIPLRSLTKKLTNLSAPFKTWWESFQFYESMRCPEHWFFKSKVKFCAWGTRDKLRRDAVTGIGASQCNQERN